MLLGHVGVVVVLELVIRWFQTFSDFRYVCDQPSDLFVENLRAGRVWRVCQSAQWARQVCLP